MITDDSSDEWSVLEKFTILLNNKEQEIYLLIGFTSVEYSFK
jgi:hypothetical protein